MKSTLYLHLQIMKAYRDKELKLFSFSIYYIMYSIYYNVLSSVYYVFFRISSSIHEKLCAFLHL